MAFIVATPLRLNSTAAARPETTSLSASRAFSRRAAPVGRSLTAVRPRAEVLWSLEPAKTPKSSDNQTQSVFPSISYPVLLTSLIDKKRQGPNDSGSIRIGVDSSSADLAVKLHGAGTSVEVEIEQDGDTGDLYISDLGSESGTFVNKRQITNKVKLCPGDIVSFGPDEPELVMHRNTEARA